MQSSAPGHSLEADTRFLTETFRHALLPAMLSMGGIMASTLTTSFLAGNLLGDETLAILSIVNPVYFLFATIGSLAGVGAASLAAWCIGKDDQESLQAAVTLAALPSLVLSAVLLLLGVLFCGPLAALLGSSGDLLEPTRQYLLVYLFSGLGIAGVYAPFFLLKLQGRHKLSIALFVGLAIGCVALELFSVRVLHLGLNGIALGWTVANLIVTAPGWLCLLGRKTDYRLLCALSKLKPYTLRLMTAGSPAALNNLCSVLRTMALNLAIVPLAGQLGLSAFSVVSMANNLALIIINGLPQTTNPFVGVFSSERDTVSLRQLMVQALRSGLLLIAAFSLLLALLAKPFCAMFGVTAQDTLAVALPVIRLFALSLPLNLLSSLMMNYYLSSDRTWLANLLTGTRAYLMVVLSLRLLQPLGIVGVWLSFTTAELLGWIAAGSPPFRAFCCWTGAMSRTAATFPSPSTPPRTTF